MALGNKKLEDLLNPISEQLGHANVADNVEMPEWEFKAKRVTDGLSAAELVDLFESEAGKIRVTAKRCTKDTLAQTIAEIVGAGVPDSGDACSVVCADEEAFAEIGLYDALRASDKVTDLHVWDEQAGQANVDKAYVATYGITYASAGIAESATIVQPTRAPSSMLAPSSRRCSRSCRPMLRQMKSFPRRYASSAVRLLRQTSSWYAWKACTAPCTSTT